MTVFCLCIIDCYTEGRGWQKKINMFELLKKNTVLTVELRNIRNELDLYVFSAVSLLLVLKLFSYGHLTPEMYIASWTVYFLGLQNHRWWWLQPWHLLLGGKAITNLDSILKSGDITLPTNVGLVKAMVFQVVMYGCESWTVKKAECRRIDAFELWCWRSLLRVPWTARRSNQCILKEISPEYSLEGLMLKLKLQYFGHLMQRTD